MRDLIVNNFSKKYLPTVSNINNMSEIENRVRLTQILNQEVEKFLITQKNSSNSNSLK